MVSIMLGTNIFYSGYSIIFAVIAIISGIIAVWGIKDTDRFKGFGGFFIGGLMLLLSSFLRNNTHYLYKIGLNYNFVTFTLMLMALLTSVIWIIAAAEIYHNKTANKESLAVYIALCLTLCFVYSFIVHNHQLALNISANLVICSLLLLLTSGLVYLRHTPNTGSVLFNLSVVMLLAKIIISNYFFQYNWLNLNVFNWLWLYIFALSGIFIKIADLHKELQKSWNTIDKLNLQMSNMVDLSPFPIMITKITGDKILLINDKAVNLFGISKKEIAFHKLKDFLIDEQNRQDFFNALEKNHVVEDFDLMVYDLINASPFWLSVSAKTVEYNNEMVLYMAFQNITSRKERENNLQNMAEKDPLTLIWNRRYFEKNVPQRIEENIRKLQNFSLLMIDADKFKNINDTYGHKNGDKVLIKLADLCYQSLRDDDIVARFGGEEFIVYLNNTNSETAAIVAERLRKTIAETTVTTDDNQRINFTVSIGVVSSEKTSSLEVLMGQVDDAMYLAKNNGRNCIYVYNAEAAKKLITKHKKTQQRNIHPIFQNEESDEISLLDNYESKIL